MFLKGREVAERFYQEIREKLKKYPGVKPGIAFILVGNDIASKAYVGMKQRKCQELGFYSKVIQYSTDVKSEELIRTIETLNKSRTIHGILVQQPLPKHIEVERVVAAVSPSKDVDGFHPINQGKLNSFDTSGFIPCTPLGIVKMLEHYKISLEGKYVVILGRSQIVGRPLSILLSQNHPGLNATVTLCHSKTQNLEKYTKDADVLIVAIGSPRYIKIDMVKEGAIVIDVGINRIESGDRSYLVGDVDFQNVAQKCRNITPVPGGVGPMTIAMLMYNTMKSFQRLQ